MPRREDWGGRVTGAISGAFSAGVSAAIAAHSAFGSALVFGGLSRSLSRRPEHVRLREESVQRRVVQTICDRCSSPFMQQVMGRPRRFCSRKCRKSSNRRSDQKKDKQRALWAGVAYEPIKRDKVFERDGWRCRACGCHTPKSERGGIEPSAPELDHIVPMSRGGGHTYGNVQLLCRACNNAKGARTMDEFVLSLKSL
jgi:5-methylcytosine-specific restriction endonuclease McrA